MTPVENTGYYRSGEHLPTPEEQVVQKWTSQIAGVIKTIFPDLVEAYSELNVFIDPGSAEQIRSLSAVILGIYRKKGVQIDDAGNLIASESEEENEHNTQLYMESQLSIQRNIRNILTPLRELYREKNIESGHFEAHGRLSDMIFSSDVSLRGASRRGKRVTSGDRESVKSDNEYRGSEFKP